MNVANENEVIDAMGAAVKEFGRVDTVIANAGIGGGAPSFSQMTTAVMESRAWIREMARTSAPRRAPSKPRKRACRARVAADAVLRRASSEKRAT